MYIVLLAIVFACVVTLWITKNKVIAQVASSIMVGDVVITIILVAGEIVSFQDYDKANLICVPICLAIIGALHAVLLRLLSPH